VEASAECPRATANLSSVGGVRQKKTKGIIYLTPLTVGCRILFMVNTNTVCECGKAKAERARACFDCLAATFQPTAHVAVAIGEPGPRFYGRRPDGSSRRFATHSEAREWAGVA
jgi:hypothetical protein